MREERTIIDYLQDILEYAGKAQSFLKDISSPETLKEDEKTLLAVVRALEVIGEAAKRVSEDIRVKYPDIPWREMAGMRDKLIHEYFGLDEDLPSLSESIARILSELGREL